MSSGITNPENVAVTQHFYHYSCFMAEFVGMTPDYVNAMDTLLNMETIMSSKHFLMAGWRNGNNLKETAGIWTSC